MLVIFNLEFLKHRSMLTFHPVYLQTLKHCEIVKIIHIKSASPLGNMVAIPPHLKLGMAM